MSYIRLRCIKNITQNFIRENKFVHKRNISTSNKNRETSTVCEDVTEETKTATEKNWISYGFNHKDKAEDRDAMNASLFFGVTLCLVIGGFIWAYTPDYRMRDWAQREAYLEVRRREKLGLPLIDPNVIDPRKLTLPSDEELANTEIII